jgi:GT2 family glycosyltransferase
MTDDPLVSIVLLNYNGKALAQHWESVFREIYPNKEIIFVDNGSVDRSADSFTALAKSYPQVPIRLVTLPTNVGYSQGNNEGVKYARGEFICLLGNDVEVDANWIRPILAAFAEDPKIGCVSPAIFRMDNHMEPDRPWMEMDPFGFTHRMVATGAPIQPVFFTEGTSMFLRRSLLERLGYLFPPEFYFMHDDVDFCWRARLQGFSCVVTARSRVFHVRGGTEPGVVLKRNPRPIQTGARNRLVTLYTNYSFTHLLFFLPVTILTELTIATVFAVRGLRAQGRAILSGVAAFLRELRSLRARRAAVQRTRVVSDRAILSEMLDPIATPRYIFGQWRELSQGRVSTAP